MTVRKNTAKLRTTNEAVKGAAAAIQWNRANPGRPPKYHEGFCHIAETAALIGGINSQLAIMFGVVESTISGWMNSHPSFNSAIKRGRAKADDEVEEALFHRAKGYSHPAFKIFNVNGVPLVVPFTEQYPPDTGAIAFWLKNRRPNEWRDRVDAPGTPPDDAARLIRGQLAAIDKVTTGE